jgi:hypothetical protein
MRCVVGWFFRVLLGIAGLCVLVRAEHLRRKLSAPQKVALAVGFGLLGLLALTQ